MKQNVVAEVDAKLGQGEAHDVEDEVEEVVDGEAAHQQVEVSHNLKSRVNI